MKVPANMLAFVALGKQILDLDRHVTKSKEALAEGEGIWHVASGAELSAQHSD